MIIRQKYFITLWLASAAFSTIALASNSDAPSEKRQKVAGDDIHPDGSDYEDTRDPKGKRGRHEKSSDDLNGSVTKRIHKDKLVSLVDLLMRSGLNGLKDDKVDFEAALGLLDHDQLKRVVERTCQLSQQRLRDIREAIRVIEVRGRAFTPLQGGLFFKSMVLSDCDELNQLSREFVKFTPQAREWYFNCVDILSMGDLTILHALLIEDDEHLRHKTRPYISPRMGDLSANLNKTPAIVRNAVFGRIGFLGDLNGYASDRVSILNDCLQLEFVRADQLLRALQSFSDINSTSYARKLFNLLKIIPSEQFDAVVGRLKSFMCEKYTKHADLGNLDYAQVLQILGMTEEFLNDQLLSTMFPEFTDKSRLNLAMSISSLQAEVRASRVACVTELLKCVKKDFPQVCCTLDTISSLFKKMHACNSLSLDQNLPTIIDCMKGISVDVAERQPHESAEDGPFQLFLKFDEMFMILQNSNTLKLLSALKLARNYFYQAAHSQETYAQLLVLLSKATEFLREEDLRHVADILEEGNHNDLSSYEMLLNTFEVMPQDRKASIRDNFQIIRALAPDSLYPFLYSVLHASAFIPLGQMQAFISFSASGLLEEDNEWVASADTILNTFISNGEEYEEFNQADLYAYWIECLRGPNRAAWRILCNVVFENFYEMGLHEAHPLFTAAKDAYLTIAELNDESPIAYYDRLLNKRNVTIDWEVLDTPASHIEGLDLLLVPFGLGRFCGSMSMDFSSVPTYTDQQFVTLIKDLERRIKEDQDARVTQELRALPLVPLLRMSQQTNLPLILQAGMMTSLKTLYPEENTEGEPLNPKDPLFYQPEETIGQFIDTHGRTFKSILRSEKSFNSIMRRLLRMEDKSHIEASKLKCVMNYLDNISDPIEKTQRLMLFFSAVRFCETGHDTAIQDYYVNLPPKFRIQTGAGTFEATGEIYPLLQLLHGALQSVISSNFSPDTRFMKDICGLVPEKEIAQAAHHIKYAKGLIGDKVGTNDRPQYDPHIGLVSKVLLGSNLMDVLGLYYEDLQFVPFMTNIKSRFNSMLSQLSEEANDKVLSALAQIHTQGGFNEYHLWAVFDYVPVGKDDERAILKEITMRGLVRLMQSQGILKEQQVITL